MFERLINSFGQPANHNNAYELHDAELQLAAALLLFSALPVDYSVTAEEGCALNQSLAGLFSFAPDKCHRMIARAASAYNNDSSIMAASTLLKHRTTLNFRKRLLAEINLIIRADGVIHENELDLVTRVERLLGLSHENSQISA
jgi:uncharacterized tellurite resistance protein B-like protein